jgi:hypothetical protein
MEAASNINFSLQLYELIRSRTDEATAKNAVEAVEGIVEKKAEQKLSGVATKQDIYALKEGISMLKEELKGNIAALKIDILKEISANNRWLVGIIFALAVMIIGLYFKH